jgi:hypothetical protein
MQEWLIFKYCSYIGLRQPGNYTIINKPNPSKSLIEREVVTEWQHSLELELVYILRFHINHTNFLNLYYNGIDLGGAINKLKYEGVMSLIKGALGLELFC